MSKNSVSFLHLKKYSYEKFIFLERVKLINEGKITFTDESTYFLSAKMLHPYPISMQNPIEGAYNTLSAITNPTGKKRFDAGRKGSIIIAKLCKYYFEKYYRL